MSYAIIRNANYKKDNLAGLYKHNKRKNTNYSNKDIDKTKSIKNYSLKQCNYTYLNAIKRLQKENNLQGRIIKTTNVACEYIITSDREFFEKQDAFYKYITDNGFDLERGQSKGAKHINIETLKKENHKLKNYIDKTLEYVSILFDFSKVTLKNLIDNFVKHFER